MRVGRQADEAAVGGEIVEPRRQLENGGIPPRTHIGEDGRNRIGDVNGYLALRRQKRGEFRLEIVLPVVEPDSHECPFHRKPVMQPVAAARISAPPRPEDPPDSMV